MFGSVLQTGQLGPVVGQFDVSEAARTAAVEGGKLSLSNVWPCPGSKAIPGRSAIGSLGIVTSWTTLSVEL